jgi:hypothetical protein
MHYPLLQYPDRVLDFCGPKSQSTLSPLCAFTSHIFIARQTEPIMSTMNENLHSSVHSPILSPIHPLSLKSQNILSALLYNLSRSSRQILLMHEMFLLYKISTENRPPKSKTFLQNCSCSISNSNMHSNYERHEENHLCFAFYFWRSENIKYL